jgi:hypothetical protein
MLQPHDFPETAGAACWRQAQMSKGFSHKCGVRNVSPPKLVLEGRINGSSRSFDGLLSVIISPKTFRRVPNVTVHAGGVQLRPLVAKVLLYFLGELDIAKSG